MTTEIGLVGLGMIGRYHADHLQAFTTEDDSNRVGGRDIALSQTIADETEH